MFLVGFKLFSLLFFYQNLSHLLKKSVMKNFSFRAVFVQQTFGFKSNAPQVCYLLGHDLLKIYGLIFRLFRKKIKGQLLFLIEIIFIRNSWFFVIRISPEAICSLLRILITHQKPEKRRKLLTNLYYIWLEAFAIFFIIGNYKIYFFKIQPGHYCFI